MANRPGLSDAERDVLKVLWDYGPATVRAINDVLKNRGRRWAYTTVATLLQRLAAKQYITSDPSTVPHVYHAAISRDELCDGRTAPLVLALVEGNRFSAEELSRLRRFLDEATGRLSSPPKSKT
jgi:BlaI family penicillinase repressor